MFNIDEIRARHEKIDARLAAQFLGSHVRIVFEAHADRATLLRALDAMAEENARLKEALNERIKRFAVSLLEQIAEGIATKNDVECWLEDEGQRVVSVDVSFLDSNGLSNKEIRETYDRLARMVANCNTLDDLQGWLTLGADDLEQLPEDVRISLRGVWKRRRDELKALV